MNYNKCYNKLVGCKKNNEKQRKQAKTNNKMLFVQTYVVQTY